MDDFGNRVDVIVYGKGAVSRLNPGQFYEHYINACSRDISNDIRAMMDAGEQDKAWTHLMTYYQIVSPYLYSHVCQDDPSEQAEILDAVYKHGIYLVVPADDHNLGIHIQQKMKAFRPPNKSQLTYVDVCGRTIRTDAEILVGEKDMIILDKADHKPMAVSGILRQHHGLPAVETRGTRQSNPSKEQPVKVIGESEVRTLTAGFPDPDGIPEMMDITNNPTAQIAAVKKIFKADNPCDIDVLVDRTKIPLGGRPIQFVKHIGRCAGWEIVDIEDPTLKEEGNPHV